MTTFRNFAKTCKNIKKDFDRYTNKNNNILLIVAKIFHNPGMLFSVLYRFERFFLYESNIFFRIFGLVFYPGYFFISYYLLNYHIEPRVDINGGLFLHNMDIVIYDFTKIGENFSIMGQTTIGTDFSPQPTEIRIGNNVTIGTGAKIIAKEKLTIADGVIIGANAVVTKNIEKKNAVVVGIPARVIKVRTKEGEI